jgi:hypothetical protein
MKPVRGGSKDEDGAAPNILVSLNCGAGVNLQNGATVVPGLYAFDQRSSAVNRLES